MKDKASAILVMGALVLAAIVYAAAAIVYFESQNAQDDTPEWAKDTAAKLDENGGSICMADGTYIRVFAHLKPTTSVEYRNGAFYVTDPSNSNLGLYVVPIDQIKWVSTVSS